MLCRQDLQTKSGHVYKQVLGSAAKTEKEILAAGVGDSRFSFHLSCLCTHQPSGVHGSVRARMWGLGSAPGQLAQTRARRYISSNVVGMCACRYAREVLRRLMAEGKIVRTGMGGESAHQ